MSRDGTAGDGAGPAADVVAEIEAAGGKAVAHTGSVSSWDDVADMISTAVETFGTLTGVVNNAGILRDSMVATSTEADWDAVIAVHLKGTFAVTKHACEYWRAQSKAGNQIDAHIVNTVSGAGLWGNVGQSAYGAAKAAIANLTVVTAMEATALRRCGQCDFAAGDVANDRRRLRLRGPTIPRWIPPAAPPWWHGCSRAQSSWLTGQILRINGDKLSRIEGFTEARGCVPRQRRCSLTVLRDRPGGQLAVRHISPRSCRPAADRIGRRAERSLSYGAPPSA